MIKNSTQLIEAAEADYKMLKETGRSGEGVMHCNGFLDGYGQGILDAEPAWHKVEDGDLPPESETDVILIYNRKIQFGLYLPKFGFSPIYVFDEKGQRHIFANVTHWMKIPDVH